MSIGSIASTAAGLVAGLTLPALAADGFAPRAELERLTGVYASSGPEPWYGGWGTRRFSFADGRWSLVFTHALDQAMQQRTFVFRTEGPYRIGQPSVAVPGAFEAVFGEEAKFVTLLADDPALVAAFGFASCGLETGEETDISVTGCAAWKPVTECGEDHDLLAMDAEGLYFGVRPADNDMCTPDRRPTALLPPVVAR